MEEMTEQIDKSSAEVLVTGIEGFDKLRGNY